MSRKLETLKGTAEAKSTMLVEEFFSLLDPHWLVGIGNNKTGKRGYSREPQFRSATPRTSVAQHWGEL